MNRRDFLRLGGAGVAGASLMGLYGCGGGAEGGSAAVEWTTWGNPGEVARFREFTENFIRENPELPVNFTPIPNVDEYDARLFTEFLGGTGPDLFYVSDSNVGTWVERGIAREITDMLTGPDSQSPPDALPDGLWGGSQPEEGVYYGIPVDCNPFIFWYNKRVLKEAGIEEEPPELYERGEWTWDAFQDVLDAIRRSGKDGYVQGAPGVETFSWATSNGGRVVDGDRYVMHEDEKSIEAHEFVYDNIQSGNMIYTATLPGNQGPEALFLSNQVGFVVAGRWFLPVFSGTGGLEFDIVPWPTNTGNQVEPVATAAAYMAMSSESANPEEAFRFLTNFVSMEGQIFRLQGGGNAVPSVDGADEVVLEGDLPEHARYFLEGRETGYAYPGVLSSVPGLNQDMIDLMEPVLVNGGDIVEALATTGEEVNLKIRQQLQT